MSERPVRVLITVASRHGATAEIGAEIARCLDGSGAAAVAIPVEQRPDPAAFDAVIIGSAVYAGRWLEPAREYAAAHAGLLRTRPVWLFSSGPIGAAPFPPDEPHDIAPLAALTGADGHTVFPGRLDPARLAFGERAMATAMRAPVGDFRDWDAIRAWAAGVAAALGVRTATAG